MTLAVRSLPEGESTALEMLQALQLFRRWLREAEAEECHDPATMVLATATCDGTPSARMVLLKDVGAATAHRGLPSRAGSRLFPQGAPWPEDGELDMVEQLGSDPARVFSTVHTAAGHGGNGVGGAARVNDACTAFHDYQMLWTKDDVSFGIDGFMHLRYPRLAGSPGAWPFDKPQFLLLNIAIGGDLGGPVDDAAFPVTMEVEHVRVYQQAP